MLSDPKICGGKSPIEETREEQSHGQKENRMTVVPGEWRELRVFWRICIRGIKEAQCKEDLKGPVRYGIQGVTVSLAENSLGGSYNYLREQGELQVCRQGTGHRKCACSIQIRDAPNCFRPSDEKEKTIERCCLSV